jgi:hypothetical protein
MGELETKSGLPLGFTNCFTNFTAGAIKIVEQGEKRNLVGNLVGEILLPGGKYSAPCPVPAFIWTDGPTFHEILSSSSSDILKPEGVDGLLVR